MLLPRSGIGDLESLVEGEAGKVNGHGSNPVVEVGVARLQRPHGGVIGLGQEYLHDDLERHPPQLR